MGNTSSPKQDWKLWYDKYVVEGAKIFDLEKELADLQAEKKRLREELNENVAFVYNQAILATPTGDLRNRLTELNILRLQARKETQ